MKSIKRTIKNLLFPDVCMMCAKHYIAGGNPFCVECTINMPYTKHFENQPNNATTKFIGRVPCVHIASLLNFYNHSNVRHMLHELKYNGRKDIGYQLGQMVGRKAIRSRFFKKIDLIIPIPLHASKLMKRGYNQAAFIAQGVSSVMDIPMREDIVIKTTNTRSQTKMNRVERVKNVRSSFSLMDKLSIQNRHILIVDDVLTTGATIEACANHLLEASGVKISIITVCQARSY